jgi:hypothetical protein
MDFVSIAASRVSCAVGVSRKVHSAAPAAASAAMAAMKIFLILLGFLQRCITLDT